MDEALGQSERLTKWICGSYTLQEKSTPIKLNVEASIGLAEHLADESIKDMLARADAQMYEHKAASKTARGK
jgi:PleD family two-component response regulator